MASNEESTAFRQFNYCSLCKLSHKVGKKHVYSKRHQQILQSIAKKFSDKIQKVKKDLFSPVVQDGNFEREAKFWCYFCKAEYLKHEIMENFTVVGAGLLEHITRKDHKSNMDQFFWDNLLKKEQKPKFLLSLEDLHIFKKAAFLAVKKRQKAEELARTKIAERIAMVEKTRLSESAVRATSPDYIQGSNTGTSLGGSDVFRQENINQSAAGRKKTVSARADGLTSVRQNLSEVEDAGNVHSGAVPPWLQPDAETSHSNVIGPTMQDFQKHLEREKKSKLPANRVGAKFDHTAKTSNDWLPSFGRVWSKGRRLQSKQHFERELRKEQFGKFRQKPGTGAVRPTSTVGSSGAEHSSDTHLNAHSNSFSSVTNDSKSDWTRADKSVKPVSSQARISGDNGYEIDKVRNVPNVTSDYTKPLTCNPYKRKRDVTYSTDDSLIANQRWSHMEVSYNNVPYKRHRTSNCSGDQMKLIQTPVLAMEERK